jgi:hypothetical protein
MLRDAWFDRLRDELNSRAEDDEAEAPTAAGSERLEDSTDD